VFYVFLCSVCLLLYGPFCHDALKLHISTLFTTFFMVYVCVESEGIIESFCDGDG